MKIPLWEWVSIGWTLVAKGLGKFDEMTVRVGQMRVERALNDVTEYEGNFYLLLTLIFFFSYVIFILLGGRILYS